MRDLIFKHREGTSDEETHRIVYIEYVGSKPHSVITEQLRDGMFSGWCNYWDFDIEARYGYIMYENSGAGGLITEMQGSRFVEASTASYWMAAHAGFKGEPTNVVRLSYPKRIRDSHKGSSINPFKVGEWSPYQVYCKNCEGRIAESVCHEHMTEFELLDGGYEWRYDDTNEPIED